MANTYIRNYYAYSYDKENNFFLVRGVNPEYSTNEQINHVPTGLIEIMLNDYIKEKGIQSLKTKEGIISYSADHYYAIVDFDGRRFTETEVFQLVNESEKEREMSRKNAILKKIIKKMKR